MWVAAMVSTFMPNINSGSPHCMWQWDYWHMKLSTIMLPTIMLYIELWVRMPTLCYYSYTEIIFCYVTQVHIYNLRSSQCVLLHIVCCLTNFNWVYSIDKCGLIADITSLVFISNLYTNTWGEPPYRIKRQLRLDLAHVTKCCIALSATHYCKKNL